MNKKEGCILLASITKSNNEYIAVYERSFNQPVEVVWGVLTKNDQLTKWMSHLEITDLRKDGQIIFNYNDGSNNFEKMKITDFEDQSVIEFEWGKDIVRFDVHPTETGSILLLKEFIKEITNHTPKDLAGWHMCLNVFKDVVNGTANQLPNNDEWEKWYKEYIHIVGAIEK